MRDDDTYSPEEAARRRDATIKAMIATPPEPRGQTKGKRKLSRPRHTSRRRTKTD